MNDHQLNKFIFVASICCFLTVITTIGIHGYFSYGAMDFEESILLFQNYTYLTNRWWVISHCLLVIVSMWGFFLLQFKKSPGYAGLGFLFYVVFGVAEIFRQLLVLFYLNGLRQQYLLEGDPEIKSMLRYSIEQFGLMGNSLFGLFILAFALGCFFYGLSLMQEKGFDKLLGFLLLFWFVGSMLAFLNDFWEIDWLSSAIGMYMMIYQPIMRLLLGYWLWQNYKKTYIKRV